MIHFFVYCFFLITSAVYAFPIVRVRQFNGFSSGNDRFKGVFPLLNVRSISLLHSLPLDSIQKSNDITNLQKILAFIGYMFLRLGRVVTGRPPETSLKATEVMNYDTSNAIFINSRSGGRLGKQLLLRLQHLIPSYRVCDMNARHPSRVLRALLRPLNTNYTTTPNPIRSQSNSKRTVNVICCGGDGTIKWLMDEACALNVSDSCRFGIVPLGTGNDLCNHFLKLLALNPLQRHVKAILYNPKRLLEDTPTILNAFDSNLSYVTEFDRWKIQINSSESITNRMIINEVVRRVGTLSPYSKRRKLFSKLRKIELVWNQFLGRGHSVHTKSFNNYFGLGIDGAITNGFDSLRKNKPYLFFHRLVNKFWFLAVWIYNLFQGGHKDLSVHVEMYCDDVYTELPKGLKGLICVNIDSYAGGAVLWRKKLSSKCEEFENSSESTGDWWRPQRSDDGLIEVVGITGLSHLAQITTGLCGGTPLAQAKRVRLVCKTLLPMQIDGEPWIQKSSVIDLTHAMRVKVVVPVLSMGAMADEPLGTTALIP